MSRGHRLHEPRRRPPADGRGDAAGSLACTMLDHVFTDAIGALRDAFENALLERQAFEERFQVDVLLGDIDLGDELRPARRGPAAPGPGRHHPDWPTWAQTAYRSWYIGEPIDEPPRIEIEIVLRVQRLASSPDPAELLGVLPEQSPPIGGDRLERVGPDHRDRSTGTTSTTPSTPSRSSYEGSYEFDEATLKDGSILDDHFSRHGRLDLVDRWCDVGDLTCDFLPPLDLDEP